MEKTFAESKNVRAIKYNPEKMEMDVEFRKGGTYRYSDVPEAKAKEAFEAESIGSFIHSDIKGLYPHKKID
jgi:hypothetical protein